MIKAFGLAKTVTVSGKYGANVGSPWECLGNVSRSHQVSSTYAHVAQKNASGRFIIGFFPSKKKELIMAYFFHIF